MSFSLYLLYLAPIPLSSFLLIWIIKSYVLLTSAALLHIESGPASSSETVKMPGKKGPSLPCNRHPYNDKITNSLPIQPSSPYAPWAQPTLPHLAP